MATGADALFPIFVSSSLDTALGVPVSSDATVLSLKRKLEQVHADLFPQFGQIIVKAVKIKRGEDFFQLPDSMPLWIASDGFKGGCYLLMDAMVAPQQRARMQDREPRDATNLLHQWDTEEACEIETNAQVDGVIELYNQPGSEQVADQGKTNQGLQQSVNTMEGSMQKGEPSEISKPVKEKKRNVSLQEITEPALCLCENTRNERRKKQIEGPSSDREYEVPPIKENEFPKEGDNVQENNMSSEIETASEGPKGDSPMTGSPGDATFSAQYGDMANETPHLILSQLEKERLVPEKDAIFDEDTEPDQLATEKTTAADGMSKESMEKSPRKRELSDMTACTSSVNPFTGVGSPEKRMCKETKATSLDTSAQEILAQHNESCKGKESSTSFEKETCKETGNGLTNGAGKDQNGSSLNHGSDTICMAEPEKISSQAGATNDSVLQGETLPTGVSSRFTQKEKRRKTESASESPSDVPLFGQRKSLRREVQKSNVVSEKETVIKNTKGDSSVAGGPGNDAGSLKSQLASVPPDEFEEPVNKGKKREKRKKVTTPEVLEAESKAYVSDKKESQTKNPRKGKSKEKEGRCTSLSDDVPKGDGMTGEDSTKEKASVPPDEFEEPVSKGKKREKRKKVTTPEVPEAGSKAYASDKKESQTKNPRKGESNEKEGRSICLSDDVPKGDGITGEDSTKEKASVPPNEFEEPVSKGKQREKRKKVTTPEVLEAWSKVYASDKKESQSMNPCKEKSKETEGKCVSLSNNVPKGDDITDEDSTEDEDELGQFRMEFRKVTIKKNGEEMKALGVEDKAFPVEQCQLSGGRNWRCKQQALPGKRLCAYHESRHQNKVSRQKGFIENPASEKEVNRGSLRRSSKKK